MALEFDPDRLWTIMRKKGVSPIDIAEKLGVNSRTIGAWLIGESAPRPGSLHQLSALLKVDKTALLSEYNRNV